MRGRGCAAQVGEKFLGRSMPGIFSKDVTHSSRCLVDATRGRGGTREVHERVGVPRFTLGHAAQ